MDRRSEVRGLFAAALILAAVTTLIPTAAHAQGVGAETHSLLQFGLAPSYKSVNLASAVPDDTLEYTIRVINEAAGMVWAHVSDEIPLVLDLDPDSLWSSAGLVWLDDGVLHWEGFVPPNGRVFIVFRATVSRLAAAGQTITNAAYVWDVGTGLGKWTWATTKVDTPFRGYDNPGKTAVDGASCDGLGCGATQCWEYECADECES